MQRVQSSLGPQQHSRKPTEPKITFARRYGTPLNDTLQATQPGGPGAHGTEQHLESSLFAQLRSHRKSCSSARFSRERRFGAAPKEGQDVRTCPGALLPRPQKGWLCEGAPATSLRGGSARCALYDLSGPNTVPQKGWLCEGVPATSLRGGSARCALTDLTHCTASRLAVRGHAFRAGSARCALHDLTDPNNAPQAGWLCQGVPATPHLITDVGL